MDKKPESISASATRLGIDKKSIVGAATSGCEREKEGQERERGGGVVLNQPRKAETATQLRREPTNWWPRRCRLNQVTDAHGDV
jgi:hypothetical protein